MKDLISMTGDCKFLIFLFVISILISIGLSILIHYYILGWGWLKMDISESEYVQKYRDILDTIKLYGVTNELLDKLLYVVEQRRKEYEGDN